MDSRRGRTLHHPEIGTVPLGIHLQVYAWTAATSAPEDLLTYIYMPNPGIG